MESIMEISADYTFTLEIRDPHTGNILRQEDLGSLAKFGEHGLFEAICRGDLPPHAYGKMERAVATPLWPDEKLKPYLKGIVLTFEAADSACPVTRVYSILDFCGKAQNLGQSLINQGMLKPNETITYRISAAPGGHDGVSGMAGFRSRLKSKVVGVNKPLVVARPVDVFGTSESTPGELFDVYLMKPVLDAVMHQAREARKKERASFLSGYLGCDPDSGRVFLAVTDAVPAEAGTQSTCTSFSFSGETFMEAEKYIAQHRGAHESCVGWEHNHTYCLGCPKSAQCSASTVFWSTDDMQVQASAFPGPHQVALVIGLEHGKSRDSGKPSYAVKMYGWRNLGMYERKFVVVDTGGSYDTN